jgi:hypothetical protein
VSGNVETCDFTVTVLDKQNPVVTCPASVVKVEDVSETGIATYSPGGPIDWNDNCAVTESSLDANIVPTEFTGISEHVVTYAVADASGNINKCNFTVEVLRKECRIKTCGNDEFAGAIVFFGIEANNPSLNQAGGKIYETIYNPINQTWSKFLVAEVESSIVNTLHNPNGLALVGDNVLLYSDYLTSKLYKFDINSQETSFVMPLQGQPTGAVFNAADGYYYYGSQSTSSIRRVNLNSLTDEVFFNLSKDFADTIRTFGELDIKDNALYISSKKANNAKSYLFELCIIDLGNPTQCTVVLSGGINDIKVNWLRQIGFDQDGTLYNANSETGKFTSFTVSPTGNQPRKVKQTSTDAPITGFTDIAFANCKKKAAP